MRAASRITWSLQRVEDWLAGTGDMLERQLHWAAAPNRTLGRKKVKIRVAGVLSSHSIVDTGQ